MQQVSDARHGPGRRFFFRQREFAHAVERDHQIVGERERVDFQLVDDERRVRIVRREVIPHADEGLKAFDELVVGNDAALPARQSGEFSIRDGLPEQPEERLSVGHGRECGYDGLPLAEAFGVQLGIGPAEARADDHAELAGAAQAHDKLIAEGFGVGRHELHLQHP